MSTTDRSGEARNYTTRDDQGNGSTFYASGHDAAVAHHMQAWPRATGVRVWAQTDDELREANAYQAAFHRGRRD